MNKLEQKVQLDRFLVAQENVYHQALQEIKAGRKSSHWMWYIFPQLKGLGLSSTSEFYGINGLEEAKAYLSHEVLGKRLIEITEIALSLENKTALEIFGSPDNMKLKSCMTLFAHVSEPDSVFTAVLMKYFGGIEDKRTLQLLKR